MFTIAGGDDVITNAFTYMLYLLLIGVDLQIDDHELTFSLSVFFLFFDRTKACIGILIERKSRFISVYIGQLRKKTLLQMINQIISV